MKWSSTAWLALGCCALPTCLTLLTGALLYLPGSALLWQTCVAGIAGGVLFVFALRDQHQAESRRQAVQQSLRNAIRNALPRAERADVERDAWAADWNLLSQEVCDSLGELRSTQLALEENRNLLETVLGTMSEGVLVLDGDRSVLFMNGAARQLLDVRSREVILRPLWEVTRSQPLLDYLQQPLPVGSEFRKPIELTRQNVVLEVTVSPLVLGQATGMVIVMHDVTELRRLERARRDFFNSVSHELKTPLTSIRCFAETLLDGGLEDLEHNRGMVTQIESQADKLNDLIQDILRLARIEARFERFDLAPVPLGTLIRDCVQDRRPVATARHVTLDLDDPGDDPLLLGDETGFRSILDNLINNAINYNRPNGVVRVTWKLNPHQLVIKVSDTGIGISLADRERIFERFFRVDKARSASTGGTGLGLAIVKHLTSVLNGMIEVDSEVGVGTTFRVIFPLYSPGEQ